MKKTSIITVIETFTILIISVLVLIHWVDKDLEKYERAEARIIPVPIQEEVIEEDPEELLPSVTELSIVKAHEEDPEYLIDVTETEIELMARVVMSEASILSIDAKQAVASTIINRVKSELFSDSVYEVITEENQYSTSDNGEITEECYQAVYAALKYECFPADMYYFRSGKYHDFGTAYIQIDGMYFSRQ